MKSLLTLILIAACAPFPLSAAPSDTVRIYYDKKWYETSKEEASYLRKYWKDAGLWMTKDYYMSGQLKMSGAFSGDSMKVKEGNFRYYYKDGSLARIASYIHNQPEGGEQEWYDNGEVKSETFYKDGKAEGLARRWNENGRIADSMQYRDGKLNGYQVWYFQNGQKSEEGTYVDDSAIAVKLYTSSGSPDPAGKPGEVLPTFKVRDGKGLSEYLADELHYPKRARSRNQQGRTRLRFVVAEDGSIIDAEIVKSSGVDELDAEALRVVSMMPAWNPPSQHNRPVKVYFTLPVTFRLD